MGLLVGFEFEDKDVKQFAAFTGLRNNVSPESFEPSDLVSAVNVDITDSLRLRRRKGFRKVQSGVFHSVWSVGNICLAASGNTLYSVDAAGSITAVHSGLTANLPISYCALGGVVYYSNGKDTGAFNGTSSYPWGIEIPSKQPDAFAIGGTLPAGTYQYAITFERADGAEGGASAAGLITLDTAGGIGFRNLPVPADTSVTKRNVYISPVNGDALYRQMILGVVETAITYIAERIGSLVLNTQHLRPPIAGQILAAYNGRVYVASGNVLYPSLPFAPELFDLRANFPFNSEITLVAPMNDGIYVGTKDGIVFLIGSDPEEFKVKDLATYGAIPGTLSFGNAQDIVQDAQGLAAFFATEEGLCYGLDGGTMRNLTRDKFMYGATERGAGLVRKHEGMIQYISVLQGTEEQISTGL